MDEDFTNIARAAENLGYKLKVKLAQGHTITPAPRPHHIIHIPVNPYTRPGDVKLMMLDMSKLKSTGVKAEVELQGSRRTDSEAASGKRVVKGSME